MINLIVTALVSLGLTVSVAFAGGHKYTIDSTNYNEYTDMLSAGQLTMFAAYPDTFRMDVYETVLTVRSILILKQYHNRTEL